MSGPTPEQRAAIQLRGTSIVLSSGAGCGKTSVLTQRFVSHLVDDAASVGQIVAITFTDKAAREMRDRIRQEIETLSDCARHLRDLETAPIATIHSFCGNVLRQFAIPAGLDPAFELLDNILSANLRAEALTAGLHGLLEGDEKLPASRALRELVVLYGYPAVVEAVDELLLEVDRPSWQKWLDRSPTDIAAEWTGPTRASLLPLWVQYLGAASGKLKRALAALERIESGSAVVMNKVRRLLTEVRQLHAAKDLGAAIEELCELAKVQDIKKADRPDEVTYETLKEAFKAIREELPKRFDLFAAGDDGVAAAAHVGQQFLRVALAVDDEYRRRKRLASMLDFQDLLVLARDLLRDHGEVRDAIRKRYRFILLDELQDTDPVQMELIKLLCGEELTHGKLFAVGDHKQSIYRFRGAEVALFDRLQQTVATEGRLRLSQNFRSQPGVIQFVNVLFAKRLEKYEPLTARLPSAGNFANVEFLWAIGEDGVADAEETQDDATSRAPRSALRAREADAIARRITDLLADESPRLLGKKRAPPRRVERGDITLLFRSMTNVATYEAALRRRGLDYYLVGGRAFFAQQEIYDVLNLLRAIENPQDSASLVGALRAPFFSLSDEAVFLISIHDDGVWAGLHDAERLAKLPADERPAAERAARLLAGWRAEKDRLPIARLLNRVLEDTGYDAALQFETLGDRKLANLWKLIDLARSFDRTGHFGLHEFTARLDDLVSHQPREEEAATLPESADVIRLMSIHQAKGLEFPVVFVPDFAAQRQGDRHPAARWHRQLGCLPKVPSEYASQPEEEPRPFAAFADDLGRTTDQLADWQEDLRILYVACTRASDLLILSAGLPDLDNPLPANHWTLALEERFDPVIGKCLAREVTEAPKLRVTVMEPCLPGEGRSPRAAEKPAPPSRLPPPLKPVLPPIVSLAALEARARGEANVPLTPQFDTEDDSGFDHFRTPRERVGPAPMPEATLWAVLERWDFADADGWVGLLGAALEEVSDRQLGEELREKLARFAASPSRAALAAALELHRNVEFLADLTDIASAPGPLKLGGVIDLLYRDAAGWHILAIDRGTALEDDPWRGRRPGLVLQGWAASRSLGEWPRTVALFDLATAQHVELDPQRLPIAALAEHFLRALKSVLT